MSFEDGIKKFNQTQNREFSSPFAGVDTEKLTQFATERARSQPVLDRTSADDMAIELQSRQEREKFHAAKVEELAKQVDDLTAKWQKLNSAIAAATKLLDTRPWLREDIATWKREMESIEEDGNKVKKVLEGHENILKQAKKQLQPVSDKNPIGFDYKKFERLKAEEAALQVR